MIVGPQDGDSVPRFGVSFAHSLFESASQTEEVRIYGWLMHVCITHYLRRTLRLLREIGMEHSFLYISHTPTKGFYQTIRRMTQKGKVKNNGVFSICLAEEHTKEIQKYEQVHISIESEQKGRRISGGVGTSSPPTTAFSCRSLLCRIELVDDITKQRVKGNELLLKSASTVRVTKRPLKITLACNDRKSTPGMVGTDAYLMAVIKFFATEDGKEELLVAQSEVDLYTVRDKRKKVRRSPSCLEYME